MGLFENGTPMTKAMVGGKYVYRITVDGEFVINNQNTLGGAYLPIDGRYHLKAGTGTVSESFVTVAQNQNCQFKFKEYVHGGIINPIWGVSTVSNWPLKRDNPFFIYWRKVSDNSVVLKIQIEPHYIYLGVKYVRMIVTYNLDTSGTIQYPANDQHDSRMTVDDAPIGFLMSQSNKNVSIGSPLFMPLGTWSNPEPCYMEITKNDDIYSDAANPYKFDIRSCRITEGYKEITGY